MSNSKIDILIEETQRTGSGVSQLSEILLTQGAETFAELTKINTTLRSVLTREEKASPEDTKISQAIEAFEKLSETISQTIKDKSQPEIGTENPHTTQTEQIKQNLDTRLTHTSELNSKEIAESEKTLVTKTELAEKTEKLNERASEESKRALEEKSKHQKQEALIDKEKDPLPISPPKDNLDTPLATTPIAANVEKIISRKKPAEDIDDGNTSPDSKTTQKPGLWSKLLRKGQSENPLGTTEPKSEFKDKPVNVTITGIDSEVRKLLIPPKAVKEKSAPQKEDNPILKWIKRIAGGAVIVGALIKNWEKIKPRLLEFVSFMGPIIVDGMKKVLPFLGQTLKFIFTDILAPIFGWIKDKTEDKITQMILDYKYSHGTPEEKMTEFANKFELGSKQREAADKIGTLMAESQALRDAPLGITTLLKKSTEEMDPEELADHAEKIRTAQGKMNDQLKERREELKKLEKDPMVLDLLKDRTHGGAVKGFLGTIKNRLADTEIAIGSMEGDPREVRSRLLDQQLSNSEIQSVGHNPQKTIDRKHQRQQLSKIYPRSFYRGLDAPQTKVGKLIRSGRWNSAPWWEHAFIGERSHIEANNELMRQLNKRDEKEHRGWYYDSSGGFHHFDTREYSVKKMRIGPFQSGPRQTRRVVRSNGVSVYESYVPDSPFEIIPLQQPNGSNRSATPTLPVTPPTPSTKTTDTPPPSEPTQQQPQVHTQDSTPSKQSTETSTDNLGETNPLTGIWLMNDAITQFTRGMENATKTASEFVLPPLPTYGPKKSTQENQTARLERVQAISGLRVGVMA